MATQIELPEERATGSIEAKVDADFAVVTCAGQRVKRVWPTAIVTCGGPLTRWVTGEAAVWPPRLRFQRSLPLVPSRPK